MQSRAFLLRRLVEVQRSRIILLCQFWPIRPTAFVERDVFLASLKQHKLASSGHVLEPRNVRVQIRTKLTIQSSQNM